MANRPRSEPHGRAQTAGWERPVSGTALTRKKATHAEEEF